MRSQRLETSFSAISTSLSGPVIGLADDGGFPRALSSTAPGVLIRLRSLRNLISAIYSRV
jgi:hypothetical protein